MDFQISSFAYNQQINENIRLLTNKNNNETSKIAEVFRTYISLLPNVVYENLDNETSFTLEGFKKLVLDEINKEKFKNEDICESLKNAILNFSGPPFSEDETRDKKLAEIVERWKIETAKSFNIHITDEFLDVENIKLALQDQFSADFRLRCTDFALLQIGEEKLYDRIFSQKYSWLDQFIPDEAFKDLLTNLGYEIVKIPKDGDLVVYGNYSESFNALHFGIWSKGKVISKWGTYSYIFEHPLESIHSSFGNCVLFLRKSLDRDLISLFHAKLDDLSDNNLIIDTFTAQFNETINTKISRCLKQSLAERYFVKWQETYLKNEFTLKNKKMSRIEIIEELKTLVKTSSPGATL